MKILGCVTYIYFNRYILPQLLKSVFLELLLKQWNFCSLYFLAGISLFQLQNKVMYLYQLFMYVECFSNVHHFSLILLDSYLFNRFLLYFAFIFIFLKLSVFSLMTISIFSVFSVVSFFHRDSVCFLQFYFSF